MVIFSTFSTLVEKEVGERLNARNLTEAESMFILTLNPGHILAFATGSSKVPAIGFVPTPKRSFVHDDTKHLPLAHTCSNELQIFVNRNNLADDDEFDYHFLVALMNGATFSAVKSTTIYCNNQILEVLLLKAHIAG